MGYNPVLVVKWYRSTTSKKQFMDLCYNEHNMKMEAAEDYWELCNALSTEPTAGQGESAPKAPNSQGNQCHEDIEKYYGDES